MSKDFIVMMPDIGEGVVEGEVVQWLKKPGDALKQDEPVVVVMTDKATVELPSPHPGILRECHIPEGQLATKGKPLYTIECDEAVQPQTEKRTAATPQSQAIKTPSSGTTCAQKEKATPAVRHLAKQLGISLDSVTGSGPDGRITAEDLKKQIVQAPAHESLQPQEGDIVEPLAQIRLRMAERMTRTLKEIPQFSYFQDADLTDLDALRKELKDQWSSKGLAVTYMPLIIKALSLALPKVPYANASLNFAKKEIYLHPHHHIGFAVNSSRGLLVPVLKNVEKKSLEEVIKSYEELKQKALSGQLQPNEMQGGTITITNFGVLGGNMGTPIIQHPESAILGLGKIEKRAVVLDNQITVRPMMTLCWTFDHRIVDGSEAALLSSTLADLLEKPSSRLTAP